MTLGVTCVVLVRQYLWIAKLTLTTMSACADFD